MQYLLCPFGDKNSLKLHNDELYMKKNLNLNSQRVCYFVILTAIQITLQCLIKYFPCFFVCKCLSRTS